MISLPSTYTPDRDKEYEKIIQRQIQDYIKGGSKGDLDLYDTPITSLPDNLKVGGFIDLRNTPISKKYTKEEIRKMIEEKGGFVGEAIYL